MLTSLDRSVEDYRLPGLEPAQRRQIAQHRGGQFGADGEVEVLEGVGLFEAGTPDSASVGEVDLRVIQVGAFDTGFEVVALLCPTVLCGRSR